MKTKAELAEEIFARMMARMRDDIVINSIPYSDLDGWSDRVKRLAEASIMAAEIFQKVVIKTELPGKTPEVGQTLARKIPEAPKWDLRPGTVVRAVADFDPEIADVQRSNVGIVFESANAHGDGAGPCVRWFDMHNGAPRAKGFCNVGPDDVEVIKKF